MTELSFYFGVHNKQIKLHAVMGDCRKNKVLSFFGKGYNVTTSIEYWEEKERRFKTRKNRSTPIPSAAEDNKRLDELLAVLERFAELRQYESLDDFFSAYKDAKKEIKTQTPTLLEYAQTYTQLCKDNKLKGKSYKNETTNYTSYRKLERLLQGYQYRKIQPWAEQAQVFANMPIDKIGNKEYNDFIHFLLSNDLNIFNNIKTFKAVVRYYRTWIMRDYDFKFTIIAQFKEAHNRSKQPKKKAQTLTPKQLKQLAQLDVTTVCKKLPTDQKQLYKDTLLLMYGLVTRPIDILSFKIEDIIKTDDGYSWNYCANKLINTTKGKKVPTPIHSDALTIIQKYKGERLSGFLLPFPMNETEKQRIQRARQANHTEAKINSFLKEIGKKFKWDIENPTMYTLRHTAITDLLKTYNINTVAAWAHTSREEISSTYEDEDNLGTTIKLTHKSVLALAI